MTGPEAFDPLAYSREELLPMLEALCTLIEPDGPESQLAFFRSACRGIEQAADASDLADVFLHLSMSAFQGFAFTPATSLLLDRVLERAQAVSEALSIADGERH